jgi:hypothetical protein
MGKTVRRQHLIIVPDKYWVSSHSNIEWIIKESNAKRVKRTR